MIDHSVIPSFDKSAQTCNRHWQPSIYATAQQDGSPPLPSGKFPPAFSSIEEERLHRRQRLAIALRIFGLFGFDVGLAGHITVRDPGNPEHFWVNLLRGCGQNLGLQEVVHVFIRRSHSRRQAVY